MERERRWMEYERSHASARRALLLTAIVLAGAVLGYRAAPGPEAPVTYSSTSGTP